MRDLSALLCPADTPGNRRAQEASTINRHRLLLAAASPVDIARHHSNYQVAIYE